MEELKELLVDEMRDLLDAETQLTRALPEMAKAARHPKLREAFEKHLTQTEAHVERLNNAFELLGETAEAKPCKGMTGLIQEGQERIKQLKAEDGFAGDLGLIAAAQKVEHYEISAYGTLRQLARQIGERELDKLLSRTLGEEESTDYLLTEISKPLLQDAAMGDGATPMATAPVSTRQRKAS
jgi:Mn-containing catalase